MSRGSFGKFVKLDDFFCLYLKITFWYYLYAQMLTSIGLQLDLQAMGESIRRERRLAAMKSGRPRLRSYS